ncbi:hypothetical protein L1987_43931 [Smallanthus sonchifolius]|uniref:Uncharacterized protein n=1 Tax=Smallanthus sonchifolius TaxID=185202 RepID=A0ACB9GP04_9ASTR|nr:hypothetical protein L1987_43931 [Smallanthus sonchifolius]
MAEAASSRGKRVRSPSPYTPTTPIASPSSSTSTSSPIQYSPPSDKPPSPHHLLGSPIQNHCQRITMRIAGEYHLVDQLGQIWVPPREEEELDEPADEEEHKRRSQRTGHCNHQCMLQLHYPER